MQLTSYLQDRVLTIALTGEIDHHCAKRYMEAICGKIEAYLPQICILDFEDVTFMDSSGVAVVINTLRSMTRLNGGVKIAGLHKQPHRVFLAAGIDKLVEMKEVTQ